MPCYARPRITHTCAVAYVHVCVQARSLGLVTEGDQVVVSQCPRAGISEVMEEAGVVKLVTVDKERCGAGSEPGVQDVVGAASGGESVGLCWGHIGGHGGGGRGQAGDHGQGEVRCCAVRCGVKACTSMTHLGNI